MARHAPRPKDLTLPAMIVIALHTADARLYQAALERTTGVGLARSGPQGRQHTEDQGGPSPASSGPCLVLVAALYPVAGVSSTASEVTERCRGTCRFSVRWCDDARRKRGKPHDDVPLTFGMFSARSKAERMMGSATVAIEASQTARGLTNRTG